MDAEHQLLFDLCDRLRLALAQTTASGEVQSILRELAQRAAHHFSHEEREMRAAGYSHYAWHRRQHQAASAKIATMERRCRRGDSEAPRELLEFLSGWLNDHIGIADRMLAAYLRNRERERASRAL